MKRKTGDIEQIKKNIERLKGADIEMSINRGRKRFETFNAVIECVYPSVFTIKTCTPKQSPIQTFSYFDVMCGDVVISDKD
jgi:uncharacterized protein Veg